jgi:aryl-alcohol dehydrogenase-like predicted oxidoreductase
MEKRKFGKTGMNVSVLGFGGAEVGFQEASPKTVEELLGGALDAGLNVIDTAECYAGSEALIGNAVSRRRRDFYLFSKCGHSRGYGDPDWNDRERLQTSLDQSLKKLKTDHLDLFQLHSCSKDILEKGDVIDFMKRAKESGKARFIGYSGENEAAFYAVTSGAFDALQTSVSIADQNVIDRTLPEAVKREMGVIAKRPIANAAWKYEHSPEEYHAPYWERFKTLQYDFLSNGKTRAVSTALRFTLSVPGVDVAIVGTQKPGRWEENAKIVAEGPLDSKTFEAIRERWKEKARPDWTGQI